MLWSRDPRSEQPPASAVHRYTAIMLPLVLLEWAALAVGAASASADAPSPAPYAAGLGRTTRRAAISDFEVFGEFMDALRVMQDSYFEPWLGTWPTAIDWTAAVMGTYVSGALRSLSRGLDMLGAPGTDDRRAKENLIATLLRPGPQFLLWPGRLGHPRRGFR